MSAGIQLTLVFLQRATLYLASLAVAEYRGLAAGPKQEAEIALAAFSAGRRSHNNYARVLIECVRSVEGSVMAPLLEAEFESAVDLNILTEVAKENGHGRIGPLVGRERARYRQAPASVPRFEEWLRRVGELRNQYAHTEVQGFDAAEDFVPIAGSILEAAAREFLEHEAVIDVMRRLEPAVLISVDPTDHGFDHNLAVRNGQAKLTVPRASNLVMAPADGRVSWTSSCGGALLADSVENVSRIVGPYIELTARDDLPLPEIEIEATVRTVLAREGAIGALDALEGFRRAVGTKPFYGLLPVGLVDEVVIEALRHFKLTTEYYDDHIPGRVVSLLDYASANLPTRIKRDAERFDAVTVRPPRLEGSSPSGNAMKLALTGPVKRRCEAVAELGALDDPDSHALLESLALTGDRRLVRKQALLALGRRGSPTSLPSLELVAKDHRSDPELASCALIGIAGIQEAGSVTFVAEYVLSDAPYRCTDAAAWALVLIAEQHPESVLAWRQKLVALAQDRNADPYTRGTVVCCLGKLRDPETDMAIAGLIDEDEDAFVIEDACAALGEIADERHVGSLMAVLAAKDGPLSDMAVRRAATTALQRIGGDRAAAALAREQQSGRGPY